MYCHACGIALTQPTTKYCNRCGVQLVSTGDGRKDKTEKRLDEYLDGLFWVTVFGLGFIVGGAILLKKVHFSDLVILIYAVFSSTVFLINFGLNLWNAVSLMQASRERRLAGEQGATSELNPARPEMLITAASVTENTTRSFEPVQRVNRSGSE